MSTVTKPKKKKRLTMAETADKYDCYQKSVQCPENEVEFFEQAYREAYDAKPYILREDFCGTYAICCEWAKSDPERTALGIDLCPEALQWGTDNNLAKLNDEQKSRVNLLEQDVRELNDPKADVLAAQNFSFWYFKTRAEVINYFKIAYENMADQGVMIMDMMGGGDCYTEELTDKRKIKKGKKGFSYHWEQARFNPVNADCSFYIHFKFGDGSKMKKAFEYHWRFWTIPEVREMLEEAGFRKSLCYWELEDEDGEDTGEWRASEEAPSNPSWICYIVGVK
ncbi:MAG: class I SAM-dependent methyltransferase [Planctomycetaceae bacterium]